MTEKSVHENADESIAMLLHERGKLDAAGLGRALKWRKETGQSIETIVTSLGLVSERDMAEILSDYLDIPIVARAEYPSSEVDPDRAINVRFLKNARILPIAEENGNVIVAMANPRDERTLNSIVLRLGKAVIPRVAIPSELDQALEELYSADKSSLAQIAESIDPEIGAEDDAERLRSLASDAPVIRLVNLLINKAVEASASDIHIEPFEARLRIRYRIDGRLNEVEPPPNALRFAIISRVKIMARMNIAERRLPQDGRIRLIVRGNEIDIRVSTVPTLYGEGVVLRILDKSSGVKGFGELGFEQISLDRYIDMLERPNGIVLVTGPTGSGKTTTLYASLLHLNKTDRKIITVEDPVEYQLYGINQIQVHPQIGLTFASILRSILRQDPDIILIGEIRDLETAQIAVQAALTGHLVLSTVHTNSAAATIARLVDMGVEDYLLNSTLIGVVAQRLVRVLCTHCKEPYSVSADVLDQYRMRHLAPENSILFHRAKGCESCQHTGYSGRISISEILTVNDSLRACVVKGAHTRDIHHAALAQGMSSMLEDGLRKVISGVTSIDEVMRATREV